MAAEASQPPIESYALVGDCHSAALVARDGSIDWWCPHRFDNAAVFAALLDAERGGRFRIRPVGDHAVERAYVGDTAVLCTRFLTDSGDVELLDFLPVVGRPGSMEPRSDVVRILHCVRGTVELEVLYQPRFDYGAVRPTLRDRGAMGIWCHHRGEALALRGEVPMTISEEGCEATARFVLHSGERRSLSVVYADREPLVLGAVGEEAQEHLEMTARWWQDWSDQCHYGGLHRDLVVRSALTLKLLAYSPTGAIIAAPTTSLPEGLGGERNWDYRYCWPRDATFTLSALMDLGHEAEAGAFLHWLLHATRLTWPRIQVLYGVYGETRLRERELRRLAGYHGSTPVRVGNAASEQLQLDTYGEVVGAAVEFVRRGGTLDGTQARMLRLLGQTVCDCWREPDRGIWEVRGEPRHFTHSKMMCWRALDGLIELHDLAHVNGPVERWKQERDAIRDAIEARGWSEALGTYTSWFGGEAVDASLLLLALQNYADPCGERMRSTFEVLRERLEVDGGLWLRYAADFGDGLSGEEGAFGICSFWAVQYLALRGDCDRARRMLEDLVGYANDVGLYAEEVDYRSGRALGNFPQAFTHVGLVHAVLSVYDCARAQAAGTDRAPGRTGSEETAA